MFEELAVKAIAGVVAGAMCFGAGWAVNGWRTGSRLSDQEAAHAQQDARRNAVAAKQVWDASVSRDLLAHDLAASDAKFRGKLNDKQAELDDLRASVASGAVGLRFAVESAPSSSAVLPGPNAGCSVDTGNAARLTADAEQAYFALREGLNAQQEQLAACVVALGRITGQGAPAQN